MSLVTITGLGQDSHAFCVDEIKPLILAGVPIADSVGLAGNSDADVVLHALCNALSSISGESILGAVADAMCRQGITDSSEYVRRALLTVNDCRLVHIAVSIECKQPKLADYIVPMRKSIAKLCSLTVAQVGITATSGEDLSAFGQGKGIQAFVLASAVRAFDFE